MLHYIATLDLQLAGCAPGHRHGCGTSTANSHGHRQDGIGTKARLEGARKDSGLDLMKVGTEKVGECTTSHIDRKNWRTFEASNTQKVVYRLLSAGSMV